jgi:CHAT domain-containing protein
LTEARSRTLQRLARTDPNRAALVGAAPPDPETTIGRLGPDDVVLEYTAAGGQFHLFVVERDRVTAIPDLAPIDDVRELVERLRFQLGKGVLWDVQSQRYRDLIRATLSDYMNRLHDLLLAPVIELVSGRRVRIVPHGVLHGLPFHALESGGVSLVDRCVVSYAPSLAAIELLSGRRAETGAPAVVLGVADSSAPLIESEVDAVRRHVDGALVYRGDRATRNALRLGERRPPLLHVACHGYFSESGPWTGGLRLGDSWLSLPDLYEMQGMADLVVLSGCQTGRGTVYSGDEWVGLVRGFLQAGAQSVVASLWEVQDRATLTLMEAFYEGLATGLPVADALAVAQRRARSEDALPLLWAPFVVIGEPDLRVPLRKVA